MMDRDDIFREYNFISISLVPVWYPLECCIAQPYLYVCSHIPTIIIHVDSALMERLPVETMIHVACWLTVASVWVSETYTDPH